MHARKCFVLCDLHKICGTAKSLGNMFWAGYFNYSVTLAIETILNVAYVTYENIFQQMTRNIAILLLIYVTAVML